jgi:hypothetical protein
VGVILEINRAWNEFARKNGMQLDPSQLCNYGLFFASTQLFGATIIGGARQARPAAGELPEGSI